MDKKFDERSLQAAMQMANTPAGQQLISLLRQSAPDVMQKASAQASAGDFSQLAKTLAPLMASEDVQKLLKQLGG